MAKYIENVNAYLSQMKIKQNYISLKSGIERNKLSRILTGTQDIMSEDMEKIARALGKKIDFFLQDSINVLDTSEYTPERIGFYAGTPSKEQEEMANNLLQLMENIDEVLSAERRFSDLIEEY